MIYTRDIKDIHDSQIAVGTNITQIIYYWAREKPTDPQVIAKARLLFESMPPDTIPPIAVLAEGSRMPFSRNPLFVGREDDLRQLAAILKGNNTAAIGQIAAATGLGGIGKTNLAIEFVHRYGQYFAGGVFWLSFDNSATIPEEIAACGTLGSLNLRPDFASLDLPEQVAAVYREWQRDIPRLLVFDNCDSDDAEELVQRYIPTTGGCRVLITSRRAVWDDTLGIQTVALDVLTRAESIAFLRKFRPDCTDVEADELAMELGKLPLALHLAGRYLQRYSRAVTVADYIAQLRGKKLLENESLQGAGTRLSPTRHVLNVKVTFDISYTRLLTDDPTDALAHALLVRAAYFAPGEPIPYDLLMATLAHDNTKPNRITVEDARYRLLNLGLLNEEVNNSLMLHRLLSRFVQDTAGNEETLAAVEQELINWSHHLGVDSLPGQILSLLPHVRYSAERAFSRLDFNAKTLCNNWGLYLHHILADLDAARHFIERGLVIAETMYGLHHPATAMSQNNLGVLLQDKGDYHAARQLLEKSYDIRNNVLGPIHLQTLQSVNNLALFYHHYGHIDLAYRYYQMSLATTEKVLGTEHSETARSLQNLAMFLVDQGRYEGARPLFDRALDISINLYRYEHHHVATVLDNYAILHYKAKDYIRAKDFCERAFAIREKLYPDNHPELAFSLNNLALIYADQRNHETAISLHRRAFSLRERVLGVYHPLTANSQVNLATSLREQGKSAEAHTLLNSALQSLDQTLGPEHPNTVICLEALADLLRVEGNYAEAKVLLERLLAAHQATYGANSVKVAGALQKIAFVYYKQGDHEAARLYAERTLSIYKHLLGSEHPDTLISLTNLADVCRSQGDHQQAICLYEQVINIHDRVFGTQHLNTAPTLDKLAGIFQSQGKYERARPLLERSLAIRTSFLGSEHLDTLQSLNNLAAQCYFEKKYSEAKELIDSVLDVQMRTVGSEHPATQNTLIGAMKITEACRVQERLSDIK